ncbi:oligosaccharide translocase sypK [Vibrio sp. JCM 19236]|nr:oligosaccharide translocase sypK [Vibrio sp. JCM 19236]
MCFLIQPFGMWWMPKRIKLAKERPEQAASYTQMGITLVGMLAMCVLCFGQLFIQYALPEVYNPSALLLVGTLLMALGKEWGELLNLGSLVKGRTLPLFWINLGVVILALSSLFMHQELSIWTIMLTLGLAQLGRALIIFFISQRAYSLPFSLSRLSTAMVLPIVGLLLAYQGITPWLILLALALQLTLGRTLVQRQGVSA